jgi:hypothetical protein
MNVSSAAAMSRTKTAEITILETKLSERFTIWR